MLTGTLDPVSNLATWTDTIEFFDDETGDAWFVAGSPPDEITIRLRDPVSGATALEGTRTGGEITVVANGVVEFTFSAETMSGLTAQTYDLGVLYEDEDVISQVILGKLPVLEGL